jgi:RNA polymerase sigma-70 factor (ECF subfamily)
MITLVRPVPIRLLAWLSAQQQTVAGLGRADSRADLAERARAGDPEAFEQLVRAAGDRLLAVARKILRDPDAAEDALQQTVITAWRLLPRLREPDRFDAWLYRILVTSCYAEANRRARFSSQVRLVSIEPSEGDMVGHIADRDLLDRAFAALTPAHRTVVVLHHLADLPLDEVARILGISAGTARSRLHYALRSLRATLEAADRGAAAELGR